MIYDDKTLEKLNADQLKKLEIELSSQLGTDMKYWMESWKSPHSSGDEWGAKVESDVVCMRQVRKHLIEKL